MRTALDCIPCFIRQTLEAVKMVSDDPALHERIMREVLQHTAEIDMNVPPPAMARFIHQRLRALSGVTDPYQDVKERFNQYALDLLPMLQQRQQESPTPLRDAILLSIAGNIIDFGVDGSLTEAQMLDIIDKALDVELDDNAVQDFAGAIAQAERILMLGDNCGEIVFDTLLLDQLPVERVTYAVRGAPILNDATLADAHTAGVTDRVRVIDNGSDAPGTLLADCSAAFREEFAAADLIISKGQGNYETISDEDKDLVFLLKVKCPVIATDLAAPLGATILRRKRAARTRQPAEV